jgi:putative addiction module component (TIGR02574 family)
MTAKAERLLDEALKLPQGLRASLAGRLIRSLDAEAAPGLEAAWAVEIDGRLDRFEASRGKALPWAKVKQNILRSRRARKRA